jgi:hypothetical protein
MGPCPTAKEGLAMALRYMFEIHGCFAVKGNHIFPLRVFIANVRGCADKSLAPTGRKQATATKLPTTILPTKLNTLLRPLL